MALNSYTKKLSLMFNSSGILSSDEDFMDMWNDYLEYLSGILNNT